jgi:hypothetical protein
LCTFGRNGELSSAVAVDNLTFEEASESLNYRMADWVTIDRPMAVKDVQQRVRQVAEATLAEQRFVTAIDVLLGLGWLAPSHLDWWRQGRIESLESVLQVNPTKITAPITALERSAQDQRLKPSATDYITRTATAASCGCASAGMLPSNVPTAHAGCRSVP